MLIKRTIEPFIEKALFQGKVIILYGARQVGKTTLAREILKKYPDNSLYLNCDEPDIRVVFTDKTSTEMKSFLGKSRLVVLDEAQRIRDIGLTLKLLADNFPEIQIIATGSSSFDLSNRISEPLTGRYFEFHLYPLSLEELIAAHSGPEVGRLLEQRMVYGSYPEITYSGADAAEKLKNIARSYLFKDILRFQNIRHAEAIEKLLQALALQIGREVSYNELAETAGIDKNTAASYIRILEKAFIIFRLRPFSRNLRNELKKLRKIYFVDTGIRNAVINNLNPLALRSDTGELWENFIISERIKYNKNRGQEKNTYFWRTREGKEIDYLEESGGSVRGFEVKWAKSGFKSPELFLSAYPGSRIKLINRENFTDILKDEI